MQKTFKRRKEGKKKKKINPEQEAALCLASQIRDMREGSSSR